MAPSSRDRISVDLHGLKAALFERAQALGVSPSAWSARRSLTRWGGPIRPTSIDRCRACSSGTGDRVRLCLRMSREQASATLDGARRAGLNPGDYVGGLVAGVPVLSGAGNRTEHLAALIASSAELSTFSRNLHHLTTLLRQGEFRPAEEYRPMLDTLGADVRAPPGPGRRRAGRPAPARRHCRPPADPRTTDHQERTMTKPEHRRRPDAVGRPALLPRQPDRQDEAAAEAERAVGAASVPPPSASASRPPWCAGRRR